MQDFFQGIGFRPRKERTKRESVLLIDRRRQACHSDCGFRPGCTPPENSRRPSRFSAKSADGIADCECRTADSGQDRQTLRKRLNSVHWKLDVRGVEMRHNPLLANVGSCGTIAVSKCIYTSIHHEKEAEGSHRTSGK
jgi:hypothetical protein